MSIEIQGRTEADAQLFNLGKEFAENTHSMQSAFISHTTEDGRTFWQPSFKGHWQELQLAEVATIRSRTLQAISDYLTENPDNLTLSSLMVHVHSPERVEVISTPFGGFKQRESYIVADCLIPDHMFNRAVAPDVFVPYLQSCFCENEDLASLLAIAGNIVDTTELHLQDDGVSQSATIRQGASRKCSAEVPSPAVLFPFSTFAEVMQPPRKFVFRLGSDPLTCKLLEADGGAWRLAAMESIAKWLKEHLPESVRIIA